ncbi:DNA topoisomerase [Psychrilyobacter atlanticus]|uniref:DNA topoisomerase n=1 Tax=Psychrilyobacter atlanticus TaxID=271091 RepID=UPI0004057844|nr:DNA topoisomerase [Psychrilyobacter atlanticus]
MKLIICEKPSLALNIAKALGKFDKKDGYFIVNDYIVTFAFGHLFELKNVTDYLGEKIKWSDIKLPFIPKEFEFRIKNDEGVKKQFKVIKDIIEKNQIEKIINCGDADREGQIIIDTIIEQLEYDGHVGRMWLPEQTKETIMLKLQNTKDNKKYLSLANEGYARTYMDWLLGINFTIYCTVKKGTLLKVGRVMTPIIKYIHERDLKIKKFKSEKYIQLVSEEDIKLNLKQKFSPEEKNYIEEVKDKLNKSEAIVVKVKKENIKRVPKKLFSLSKLQSELSKSHKISFENSLKTIQSLYEKQLITYPRTNTEYLAENEIEKIEEIIKNYSEINLKVEKKKSIFDDSKIESHSAIIVTNKKIDDVNLNKVESIVYDTILNRFISNFLNEETVISKTTLEIKIADEIFNLKGEVIDQEGFLKYEPEKITDNLPKLKEGDRIKINFKEVEKETIPPKKINESSLAAFLKNPFKTEKTTEDEEYRAILEGVEIGTEATRTGVITKCLKEGYISRQGQNFSIEPKGEILIETLKILEVDLFKERNIEFSKKLKRINKGELSLKTLIDEISKELIETLSKVIEVDKVEANAEKEIIGKCPKCGKNIYQGKTKTDKLNYYCEGYKDGCKFTLWEEAKHYKNSIKITKAKAKLLLKKNGTAKFMVGKSVKKLKIKLNGDWVNFEEKL